MEIPLKLNNAMYFIHIQTELEANVAYGYFIIHLEFPCYFHGVLFF